MYLLLLLLLTWFESKFLSMQQSASASASASASTEPFASSCLIDWERGSFQTPFTEKKRTGERARLKMKKPRTRNSVRARAVLVCLGAFEKATAGGLLLQRRFQSKVARRKAGQIFVFMAWWATLLLLCKFISRIFAHFPSKCLLSARVCVLLETCNQSFGPEI